MSELLNDDEYNELSDMYIKTCRKVGELEELNKAHLKQHLDNHIKVADLLIENKRLKTELRDLKTDLLIGLGKMATASQKQMIQEQAK